MLRYLATSTLLAAALLVSLPGSAAAQHGQRRAYCPQCRDTGHGHPDLFHNFYVPGDCGAVPAGMYPAPHTWVPPHTGHTFFTYQPLMPHEMLYHHHRYYYRYYNGGRGLTRTAVHWYSPPLRTAVHGLVNTLEIPR